MSILAFERFERCIFSVVLGRVIPALLSGELFGSAT